MHVNLESLWGKLWLGVGLLDMLYLGWVRPLSFHHLLLLFLKFLQLFFMDWDLSPQLVAVLTCHGACWLLRCLGGWGRDDEVPFVWEVGEGWFGGAGTCSTWRNSDNWVCKTNQYQMMDIYLEKHDKKSPPRWSLEIGYRIILICIQHGFSR